MRKRRELFTRPWEWTLNRHMTALFHRGNSALPLCFSVLGCVEKSSPQFFCFFGTQKDGVHIIISRLNVNFASRCHINMMEGCDMWQGNLHQDVINRAHNFSLTFSAEIIIFRACVNPASKHTPPRHDPHHIVFMPGGQIPSTSPTALSNSAVKPRL